ncbi:iron donor protein CyaY [Orrella sp. NBD-18]|uniref:Iron-sulfur cluster assembly protein CyaY n=1 Tax=Sheuella amnicola TaxID=2707330 RepID=A0A6B2QZ03_9BURK|nr:iron donor protein CyaY [Sheuella amnicola]NDY82504.1 iron donor protein CyaY [Sheuella amnicola]HBI84490.1 iron donor protein CyaY [Alcaligenaceae bacterium]
MNDTEFHARATAILDAIEAQADHWFEDLDLDVETARQGNVLNLIFENGHQVVINSQAPLQEMWLAARSGGFHYRFDGQHWKDTRGGADLHDALSKICSDATGQALQVKL